MSVLYVNENGAIVNVEQNRIGVTYRDGMHRSIPIETLEAITILGSVQVTTACMEQCLQRGIVISYFSKGGKYFGRISSTGHVKAGLQRKQCALYMESFSLELAKRIIFAKLQNQLVVLRRYAKSKGVEVEAEEKMILNSIAKLEQCDSIEQIMGYEGNGARSYFSGLSRCVDEPFRFNGRSRRPPMDEFNSMISLSTIS